MVWPDDIPPEVAAQQAEQARKERAKDRVKVAPTAGKSKASTRPTQSGAGGDKAADPASPVQSLVARQGRSEVSKEGEKREDRARSDDLPRKKDSKRPLPPYLRVVK